MEGADPGQEVEVLGAQGAQEVGVEVPAYHLQDTRRQTEACMKHSAR